MGKLYKLSIFNFAKFQAFLAVLIGFILGILYSFGGLIVDSLVTVGLVSSSVASTQGLSLGTVYAFGSLIGMPVICGVLGFITGVIEALLYNIFAKLFGGLDVNFLKYLE